MRMSSLAADETKLLLCGIFGSLGVIFLIVALIMILLRYRKHKNCTASVGGRVVRYVRRRVSSSGFGGSGDVPSWSYFPIVEFVTHDGILVRQTSNYGESREGESRNVVVCYNPKKPEEFYLQGRNIDKVVIAVMLVVSFLCLCAFGVVMALNV